MTPTKTERSAILDKIKALVSKKYYDPAFDQTRWAGIVQKHRSVILEAPSREEFESAISAMLKEFTPKGLGLLSKRTPINPRNAINASFAVVSAGDGLRWAFQDVLPGGVAARAGIKSGDILLTVQGRTVAPVADSTPEPSFEMHQDIPLTIARGTSGEVLAISLATATPKYKDNPYSEPTALTVEAGQGSPAYLRVALFPGKIGIDFANALDSIFQSQLRLSKTLIIDLRGNPGGGIGGLTLMSYLTPDRLPIGYSRNREMAMTGKNPSTLPIFDRVPRSKLAIPGLAIKFFGKTSVHLYTEALGQNAYKGRTAILVNEHTTGAAEMVAQFAQENGLATIIGTKTPGRLVSRSATKLGYGYRLVVPVAAYISAKGTQIEGRGITPDVAAAWSFEDARNGIDNQLEAARKALSQS